MSADELPGQIRLLVDNLRKQNTASLSLTDVASVTEVLMGTMQVFFANIDTSVYRECRALSDYISNARKEIASLQPSDLESARIPRAGLELDAIVQSTEDATNTIMEAAEEIMGADTSDAEAYQAITQDAVMRIFEACSFQDITGQRISKVVETLSYIEKRVLELRNLLGVTEDDIEEANTEHQKELDDRALLSGPALEGEGIDQSLVDELLGENTAPAPEPETVSAPEPKEEAAEAVTAPPPPPAPEPPKPVNPRQLDSMFEEDFDPVAELAAKEAEKEEAKKAAEEKTKKAEAKKEEKKEENIDLPAGEEVSQDDIDALFG